MQMMFTIGTNISRNHHRGFWAIWMIWTIFSSGIHANHGFGCPSFWAIFIWATA